MPNQQLRSAHETSDVYLGEAGERYFAAQQGTGKLSSQWNLPLWVAHIGPDDKILDFGCGGGDLLALLPGTRKVGVEINPAARLYANRLGIQVYETLADVPEGKFSRVISSHALEHLPNPLAVLQELRSRVAPIGKLVLLLPLDDWRSSSHRSYKKEDINHHLYGWTPQNLGNLLSEAGFSPETIKVVVDALPPIGADLWQRWPILRSAAGRSSSILLRRRQILAVARNVRDA